MANIEQVKLPDGNTYNIKDAYKSGIYTVIGTQTAATGSWTGKLHGVSALYDGLTIMYYLPYAGSGNATLNLTLDSGSTTGAVNCYYGNTTRLTTHYSKGSNIIMTYWSAGSIKIDGTATTDNRWIANANYADGNTKNTAGSTDTSSKIFLVGATSQAASPQTYSHDTVYVGTDGHVYSNSKQVVNLSDTQALTNKTYNGYTLGTSCAKDVPSSGNASTTQVVMGNDTRLTNSRTPTSHTHGNIQNGGTLQTNDITIANGDKIIVTDSSDSAKVARTSISFDGSTATKALTQKGTWETFGTSNLALGTTSTTALKGDTKYAGSSSAGGSATSAVKLDTATAGSATQPCYFTGGKPSACTYSLNKTVPANAVFTDTNNAVTQTATSTDANYEVLFSSTADNTTRTEGARKNDNLTFNPSTGGLTATSLRVNGSSGTNGVTVNNGILLKNSTFTNNIATFNADYNSGGGCLKLYNSAGNGESVAIYSDLNNSGSIWLSRSDATTADKNRVQIGSSNGGAIYLKDNNANATIGITGVNGNINCSTVNNHTVPSVAFGYTRHTFTSSATLSYTGKSVTCPTGKKMIVRAYFRYVNNGPQQVLASLNSTTYGGYYSEVLDHKNGGIGGCLNFVLNSGETAYYWAKYSGAGTNYIDETTITFTES